MALLLTRLAWHRQRDVVGSNIGIQEIHDNSIDRLGKYMFNVTQSEKSLFYSSA